MAKVRPPARSITAGGRQLAVTATVHVYPNAWRLIALADDGSHYVAHQDAAGLVAVIAGPTTGQEALAAACRVLAGADRSVTGDGLRVAGALVARAVAGGEVTP